ncbi:MAG: hypothetical protein R3213_07820 [Flavobacteriaceae bacterium]|nr:hypothetical protein [Flavobacteriaceae bacterium]
MIFVFKYFIPKGYTAMSIFPFIILKRKNLKVDRILINHERIHLRQQLEMLIIPFYIWYFIEFLTKFFKYCAFREAYYNLSFEKEAYKNDGNLEYLKTRKAWSFLEYL